MRWTSPGKDEEGEEEGGGNLQEVYWRSVDTTGIKPGGTGAGEGL